ncbi:hypothetical protein GCM10007415_00040 [Parapedobacter pyrenivorans]|uniref:Uncharacterized protein n=1 Tax=Parapedobacter pyrenivorans TaxID=1305674 RepID=A0A917HA95_9SPHI|nr:hypothetical protein [Parapedobacter pyrenivorans]GGG72724.1 hypothetical protein GCM10007415_00040 [Parapedobacter pyrenivorans]
MKTTNLQLGIGTGSGTLLSVIAQLGMYDMLKTAVLAAIGAVVSFAVSLLLQRLTRRSR